MPSHEAWQEVSRLRLGGRTFEFGYETGEIVESRHFSETQIASSGGGGYIQDGTGALHAPTIRSSTEHFAENWVRLEDGTETSVVMPADFPCRTGHQVVLVYAIPSGETSGEYLAARNLHTGRYAALHRSYGWFVRRYRIGANQLLWWLGTVVALAVLWPLAKLNHEGVAPLQALNRVFVSRSEVESSMVGAFIGVFAGLLMTQAALFLCNWPRVIRLERRIAAIGRVLAK